MKFQERECVKKKTGYKFKGYVVGRFYKLDNATVRYVVENLDGLLHICSEDQLEITAEPIRKKQ